MRDDVDVGGREGDEGGEQEAEGDRHQKRSRLQTRATYYVAAAATVERGHSWVSTYSTVAICVGRVLLYYPGKYGGGN